MYFTREAGFTLKGAVPYSTEARRSQPVAAGSESTSKM